MIARRLTSRALVVLCLVGGLVFGGSGVAFALPEGRVYEMVSPVYKGGYGAESVEAMAPDGESVVFGSLGQFVDSPFNDTENKYLARRGATEWSTTPITPPFVGGIDNYSADLRYVLGERKFTPSAGASSKNPEKEYVVHALDTSDIVANWEVFGNYLETGVNGEGSFIVGRGESGDLCDVVLGNSEFPRLPEAAGTHGQLYDVARGCDGEPSLRLVGVKNRLGVHGEPEVINRRCAVDLGLGSDYVTNGAVNEPATGFGSISGDGSELFFTTNVEVAPTPNCGGGVHQLFVRVGGEVTLEVSRPLEASERFGGCVGGGVMGEVPCSGAASRASAFFKGASEDGSRVFFTTAASLVGEDKDSLNDLYMASIGCPEGEMGCAPSARRVVSLVQVSHDGNVGEAAEVQGVVSVAPDGARVYFVAHGVVGEASNAEGIAPVSGAENLYVYDAETGKTVFVADLCSGAGVSGGVADGRCPAGSDSGLWTGGNGSGEAQSTGDGGFLVFSSYGRLTRDDTDSAKDVYRYDTATGSVDRVSLGEAGYSANGNSDAFDAAIQIASVTEGDAVTDQYDMKSRAISEDGSRIVFASVQPLSVNATNGRVNVYEWHEEPGWSEGVVSLVSGGSSPTSDYGQVISPSGRDVFFRTEMGLVAQDTDGAADIYDARLGGGFPVGPAPRQPCSGDACQGPLTNPAPLLVPGSESQEAGENVAPPPKSNTKKTKKKAKVKVKSGRKGKGRRASRAQLIGAGGGRRG